MLLGRIYSEKSSYLVGFPHMTHGRPPKSAYFGPGGGGMGWEGAGLGGDGASMTCRSHPRPIPADSRGGGTGAAGARGIWGIHQNIRIFGDIWIYWDL